MKLYQLVLIGLTFVAVAVVGYLALIYFGVKLIKTAWFG